MARLRMAVVGVGHLGKEHARIVAGLPDVELVGVVDVNRDQAQFVAGRLGVPAFTDFRPLLAQVDAASIVVPTTYHHAVGRAFLEHGIPVLIEKPLARTLEEAEDLVELAVRRGVVLQVGHIERFNLAFEELQRRPLRPKFIGAHRIGPFSGRSTDIGVVLDLMIHDLDLVLALVQAPVQSVEAIGVSILSQHEDVANARLHFANGCVAEVTASRASPEPSRCMHVWGAEGYGRIDFQKRLLTLVQPSAHLRDHGLDAHSLGRIKEELFGRHLQTLQLNCAGGDQLTAELAHFVQCVRQGTEPRVTGGDALNAIALADRILASIHHHRWEGNSGGPIGPHCLPLPCGPLFQPYSGEAAA
jgi:predicted dehydrogenase